MPVFKRGLPLQPLAYKGFQCQISVKIVAAGLSSIQGCGQKIAIPNNVTESIALLAVHEEQIASPQLFAKSLIGTH
jgi:hypothetical protein